MHEIDESQIGDYDYDPWRHPRFPKDSPVEAMQGGVIVSVDGMSEGSDDIVFTLADGRRFRMYHYQDCCESVSVNEVIGDPDDLLNVPLRLSEAVSSEDTGFVDPYGSPVPDEHGYAYTPESWTWTFYRFGTVKGYVTLRWLGTSNGWYSESVSFDELAPLS